MLRGMAVPLLAWGAGFASLAALLHATAPATGGAGATTMLALLAPFLVAVGVPATAGRLGPGIRGRDVARECAGVLAPGIALLVCALPLGLGTAIAAGTFLAAWSCLAAGMRSFLGGTDPDAPGAQAFAALCLVVLIGGVFAADSWVERYRGEGEARAAVIGAVVGSNPMLVLAGDILKIDLMHAELMYGRLSVIARFYPYRYPDWMAVAAAYAAAGGLLAGLGVLLRAGWARVRLRFEGAA